MPSVLLLDHSYHHARNLLSLHIAPSTFAFISYQDHIPDCYVKASADVADFWEMIFIKCSLKISTHWGRDKMDAISQTTFSSAFSWMKIFEFRLKFHWSLFQASSHYLNQWWLINRHKYASLGLYELRGDVVPLLLWHTLLKHYAVIAWFRMECQSSSGACPCSYLSLKDISSVVCAMQAHRDNWHHSHERLHFHGWNWKLQSLFLESRHIVKHHKEQDTLIRIYNFPCVLAHLGAPMIKWFVHVLCRLFWFRLSVHI